MALSDKPDPSEKLTPKQEAFVHAYLEAGNASEAYRRTYNVDPGCKPNTIEKRACELLQNGKVAGRLRELRERSAAQAVLSRAWIIDRLMRNADKALELEDVTGSNKALELLGKTDEMRLFLERSESDNRHHHKVDSVSAFDGFLAEAAGSGTEGDPEEPVPN
jgi:phage terminase small subunit